jgi:5'-nucleotidase
MHRLALAAALLAAAGCSTGIPAGPPPAAPIRFLSVNDVYVLDTLSDGSGGLARAATLRARLADAGPVLFVLPGDVLSPSLLSKYYRGSQMVEGFNAAGLNYATFGNHEFELRRDTLVARIRASRFRWLSSNCTEAGGVPFPGVSPFDTVRMGPHKVGLFAVTLQRDYPAYVRCTDPDSAARRAVDTLAALGADLVVGITHQAVAADVELLRRDPRVDLVLGGHEHEAHDSVVGGRHVLKADANSRSAQTVTLWGGKGKWRMEPRLVQLDRSIPFDTAVQAVVRRWTDSLRTKLGPERIVGRAVEAIDARDGLQRRAQTRLGNLLTDAMRSGTGADVALINSGTLRLDDVIPAGPISSYTIESIFLFADDTRIVTATITGARLRELIEHGVSDRALGAGAYPQLGGVLAQFDRTRPQGSRLVGDLRRPDGRAIAPTDRLVLAIPVYPACEGGDGYRVPEAAEACRTWQQAPRSADLLVRHIEQQLGGVVPAATEDRLAPAGSPQASR